MSLVTELRYRAITGDTTTAASAISARIEEAVELLEDELDRPLAEAERTERLHPTRDGSLWPRATPITTATGWTIDGERLIGAVSPAVDPIFGCDATGIAVTYTGGWVERTANPSATNRLPVCIERDLAWVAWALQHRTTPSYAAQIPAGATSVRLGDASVTFAKPHGTAPLAVVGIVWSPNTLGYLYRVLGGR